jgi:oligopeptide transport system permease protein
MNTMTAEDIAQIPDEYFRFIQEGEVSPYAPAAVASCAPPTAGAAAPATPPRFFANNNALRRLAKNKAAVVSVAALAVIIGAAFCAPLIAPYNPNAQNIPQANLPPRIKGVNIRGLDGQVKSRGGAWQNKYADAGLDGVYHVFGTDEFGRDLFSRALYGSRISLVIACIAALLDMTIGVAYGLASALKGGRADTVMQRALEILSGIPSLVLVVLLILIFRPGIASIIFALAISSWIPMSRLVRAQTLRVKNLEYVLSARALGASTARIAFSHVLPNIASAVIVRTMFSIPSAIFFETFLSFIGVGMKIPNASLGTLLGSGYKVFRIYPYQMWFPAIILCVIMLAFNLFADGLRDAFDSKLRVDV